MQSRRTDLGISVVASRSFSSKDHYPVFSKQKQGMLKPDAQMIAIHRIAYITVRKSVVKFGTNFYTMIITVYARAVQLCGSVPCRSLWAD
jgi:hypothetical protein